MAHGPDLKILNANCSRERPRTPCAGILRDEIVLRVLESPALWAGFFTPCSLRFRKNPLTATLEMMKW